MNEEKKSYQLTCFLSPLLQQEKLDESVQKIKQMIVNSNGSIQEERSLIHPIKKNLPYKIQKHEDAFYLNLNFLLPISEMHKLCEQLNLEKNIIRYLITIQKQSKEYKKTKKSKIVKQSIDSKMIDRIEPLWGKVPTQGQDPDLKGVVEKEKVKIQELDKKLDEILNE